MARIENDLEDVMDSEVTNDVKDVYDEEVIFMYDEFEPEVYERRYERNGFGDKRNWETVVYKEGKDMVFELTNETHAENDTIRLDEIIEEGIYDWKRQPPARPVYERATLKIREEKTVENALTRGFKKRGYEIVK